MGALAILLLFQVPNPSWAASVEKLSIVGILVLGFGLFVYALLSRRLYTATFVDGMKEHYEERLVEKDGEVKELKEENRDQNAQIVRLAADMVRLNDQYQQTMRELASAGMGRRVGPDER